MATTAKNLITELRFILNAHILNPLWRPRDERRLVRCAQCYKRVEAYLDKYRDFVKSLKAEDTLGDESEKNDRIFSIWFQGEQNAPLLVRICFKRLREIYGDRLIVLDKNSLFDWISLPQHVIDKWNSKKILHAHFSDICRVELLYQHGGMWFDATDFLTSSVPEWIEKSDIFIYACGDKITPHKLIQSCFMKARKGYPLFSMWREFLFEYWKKEDRLVDYFLLHYMIRFIVENNEQAYRLFYEMPQIPQDPTHILWHKNKDCKYSEDLYYKSTKDSFFQKTTFKCKSAASPKAGSVAEYILKEKTPPPLWANTPT